MGNPPPPPPPPIQLLLAVSTDETGYKVGEVVQTYYRVTAQTDGSPVPGATVDGTLTDAKGNRYGLHALTDANGLVAAGFQTSASGTGRGVYSISGTANKTGYLAAHGSMSFQVK